MREINNERSNYLDEIMCMDALRFLHPDLKKKLNQE